MAGTLFQIWKDKFPTPLGNFFGNNGDLFLTIHNRTWLRQVAPTPSPRDQVWGELLGQLEEADTRVDRITRAVADAWSHHPQAALIRAWQALRGIDWLTAATLVAEAGDLSQFAHPRALMAWLGLVPCEASSGGTQHRGGLTKTGNAHLRWILIEAAHRYRYRPSLRGSVGRRLAQQGPWERALSAISLRAQQRLYTRLRTLQGRRGSTKALAAVARELCWSGGVGTGPIGYRRGVSPVT